MNEIKIYGAMLPTEYEFVNYVAPELKNVEETDRFLMFDQNAISGSFKCLPGQNVCERDHGQEGIIYPVLELRNSMRPDTFFWLKDENGKKVVFRVMKDGHRAICIRTSWPSCKVTDAVRICIWAGQQTIKETHCVSIADDEYLYDFLNSKAENDYWFGILENYEEEAIDVILKMNRRCEDISDIAYVIKMMTGWENESFLTIKNALIVAHTEWLMKKGRV